MFNPYSIPTFLSSFFLLCFGLFTIRTNVKSLLNIAFLLICISCAIWLLLYSFAYNFTNLRIIMLLFRIAYCGITFISVTTLFYTTIFVNYFKKINFFSFLFGLISCYFILASNLIIRNVKKFFWGYYPLAGKLHPLYLIFFIFLLSISFILIIQFSVKNRNNILKRNQAKYILLAYIIFAFASFDFFPNYGIELYPFGYIPTIIFLAIVAFAIIKHHLMDINIVIRKGLVYSILISLFTIIYLSIVIVTERFFQGILGYRSLLISILFASIIALIFTPLKNRIQFFIDKIFLGKTPNQIAEENELLRQELLRSEKLKTVATFASGMAHEIKNPLTAIRTFTEFLPQKKDDKEFLDKFSKIVSSEVEKIDDLVHQLLDYSKPAPLQLKDTDIHKLIDETLDLLNNQFIKSSVNVKKDYSLSAENSILRVDQNQMKQVFLNLFLNAIEAMSNSGTLTVGTKLKDVESSLLNAQKEQIERNEHQGSKFAEIFIQDTGCGISEKDLPHIFEPFYSKKEKGSGLGLSIVYNIVKEHRGKIFAESKLAKGTKFVIFLPLRKEGNCA